MILDLEAQAGTYPFKLIVHALAATTYVLRLFVLDILLLGTSKNLCMETWVGRGPR